MSKIEWQRHWQEAGRHDTKACAQCAKRRATKRRNAAARDRSQILRDSGMVRTPYGWE